MNTFKLLESEHTSVESTSPQQNKLDWQRAGKPVHFLSWARVAGGSALPCSLASPLPPPHRPSYLHYVQLSISCCYRVQGVPGLGCSIQKPDVARAGSSIHQPRSASWKGGLAIA